MNTEWKLDGSGLSRENQPVKPKVDSAIRVNPDRLNHAELSAIRDLQRCIKPPQTEDPVWERLGAGGLRLVKPRAALNGVPDLHRQVLTARGYAYRPNSGVPEDLSPCNASPDRQNR
jgi:hypothetical protein